MNTKDTQESHKYFPEFMLKAFYGKKEIIYYNAATMRIVRSGQKSKEFNAEKGYYTSQNEKILNEESESDFHRLSRDITKKARSHDFDFQKIKINPKIIYNFFAYQIIRDPTSIKVLMEKMSKTMSIELNRIFSLQNFQNQLIPLEKELPLMADVLEKNFSILIEPNFTNINFIAINAPISRKFTEGLVYILVSSPKVAFCLVSKGVEKEVGLDGFSFSIRNDGLNFVTMTNEYVMAHAIMHSPHQVLGKDTEYLKMIGKIVKQKINEFN